MLIDLNETCFNNLIGFWKTMVVTNPEAIVESNDSVQVNSGIDIPLFNPIFINKNAQQLPLVKDNLSHSFWLDSKRNKQIPSAKAQAFEPIMQQVPIMSIVLDKEFTQEAPPKITISMIKGGTDLSDWIVPVQTAFQLDDKAAARYRYCLEQAPDHFVHFIAKDNEKVVAAASLYLHKDIAGLYNLAVLPDYRKQGIGTALHFARLNEAKSRGFAYATLQATPMAAALDAALGFEIQSELSIFKC